MRAQKARPSLKLHGWALIRIHVPAYNILCDNVINTACIAGIGACVCDNSQLSCCLEKLMLYNKGVFSGSSQQHTHIY